MATTSGETHIRTCFRCGEEEEAAHGWDGGEIVSTATCKTPGSVKYNCTLCVATKTEQTEKNPANHADYGTRLANAVAAVCTEPGYTGDTVCDGCGAVLEAGEELAALGHDFDDWTDNGETHIRTCFRCSEEEEAAHIWGDGEVLTVATCKTPGCVKYNCTLCVATKTEQTEKNSANHADYGTHLANAVAAGCTEPGYTGDTVCDGCGAVLEEGEAISALGHDFDDWTDNGETHIRTCFRCGEEEEAAHVWDGGETVSVATCKTPGSVKYNCTLCVATKTEQTALDSSNHADYGTRLANAVTAGCTEPGYTGDTVCDGCGAVLEAGEELSALGHDFDDWTDNGETHIRTCFRCGEEEEAAHIWDGGETVFVATCKTPGSVKYNCTLCVATKTEQTALDSSNHADYGTHIANAVTAGCTEPGYTGDTVCDGCGAVLEAGEAISALGHDFDDWTDNGETHLRTCFRCGCEEEAAHVWNDGEIVSVATCKTPGNVKYNCTLCVATKTEQTEKNSANHADYGTRLTNAVAAGCTEPGYTGDTVCDGCGAVLEAGEELAALGHDFIGRTTAKRTSARASAAARKKK